jgi:[acyl-carrier-protein] S-malonyltransferase
MQRAGETIPCSMAAIIGLPDQNLDKVISESSAFGIIQAANFNSPGQVVLSGEVNAIKKSIEIARANGAKLAKELVVSGAFHSPLMKSAERELEEELLRIEIKSARIPICMNVSAKPVTDANQIRENLVLQLTSPVLWHQSVQAMVQAGITEFLEAGPQKVLQGLVKRIDPNVKNSGIDTDEDIEKYIVANTVST